jgi:hypothetical protein
MPEKNDARSEQNKSASDLESATITKTQEKKTETDNRSKKARGDKRVRPNFQPNIMQIWVPIIINAMLLLVVAGQAYIYRRQWEVMQQQLKQAKAIQEVSERPWVVAIGADIKNPPKAGEKIEVTLHLINSGKTPANNTIIQSWMTITNQRSVQKFERTKISTLSNGVVAPSFPITQKIVWDQVLLPLTAQNIVAIETHVMSIYVYGVTTYDIPGGRGQTDFCFIYEPGNTPFSPYEEGNYAK